MIISKNMSILFAKLCENIYNNNMKRLFLLILSFIFLGGAVSSSAFFISSSLNAVETRGGSSQSEIKNNDHGNLIDESHQIDNNETHANADTVYFYFYTYDEYAPGLTIEISYHNAYLDKDITSEFEDEAGGLNVNIGSMVTVRVASLDEGYIFDGWYDDYYDYNPTFITDDYTYTFQIIEDGMKICTKTHFNGVFINYYSNDGNNDVYTQTKEYGLTVSIYSPSSIGFSSENFICWNTSSNGSGRNYYPGDRYSSDSDLTLYAQWVENLTISFNANGGQGNMASLEVEPNASVVLTANAFIRTGYEFAGWALSSTGAVVYSDGQTITPTVSMTLYAVWRVQVYTITLDWQGGSGGRSVIYFQFGGSYAYTDESCSTGLMGSALLNNAERAGFSFVSFTTNADGSGTVMYQDYEYLNLNTIVADDIWYAQWQVNNEAKYDSVGGYWYVENGKIPQTKVTNSTLISNLNKATTNGANYYIAGLTLQARVYNGTEYCQCNGNWYEVEPIRWRLTKDSNQTNGYGTTTDINAVLAEIVFVGQYSSAYLGSGAGYSTTAVEEFKKNGIDETYLMDYQNEAYNFGNGTTMYNLYKDYTNMFVANESEINSVSTTTAIEFSDLAKDIIKSYGGTNVYFTRDLGSNYNNIVCFNEVGREVQRFATDYRGVQFTVRFTEYGCVD